MFTIFNKTKEILQESVKIQPIQTDAEVIEEIHNSFDRAGEELLQMAKNTLKELEGKDLEKGKRMQALGFVRTKEAVNAVQVEQLEKISKETAEIVSYYQNKYPNYKFITEDVIKKICQKYNLVFGDCSQYKGDIPDKNLTEIENFKDVVKEEDLCYVKRYFTVWGTNEYKVTISEYKNQDRHYHYSIDKTFRICAPLSDMKTEGYKLEGHKLVKEVPDPIVLFPVNNGFLIVSKWGLEGNDVELQNPNHN